MLRIHIYWAERRGSALAAMIETTATTTRNAERHLATFIDALRSDLFLIGPDKPMGLFRGHDGSRGLHGPLDRRPRVPLLHRLPEGKDRLGQSSHQSSCTDNFR